MNTIRFFVIKWPSELTFWRYHISEVNNGVPCIE